MSNQLSPFELSYLGDAWYEIWCRQIALSHSSRPFLVHLQSSKLACCQTQAKLAKEVLPHLTGQENLIFRRGKNRQVKSCPKHASVGDYRHATGFECLVGYWHLNHKQQRFQELMEIPSIQEMITQLLEST